MQLVQRTQLSTAAGAIEFTSIPQDATDLVLVLSLRGNTTGSTTYLVRFNGDSGANYDKNYVRVVGTTLTAVDTANATSAVDGVLPSSATTAFFTTNTTYIKNYTASQSKLVSSDFVNIGTNSVASITNNYWNSSSAITSITITTNGTFATLSSASLYKITKA